MARPPRSAVRAAVRESVADLEPGDRVLVALSGGPDSLALLAATIRVSDELGLVCGAVVVDHGIQEGSATVAARAAEQAQLLGCDDVRVLRVQVASGSGSGGPEAAARTVRYAALEGAARGAAHRGADPASGGPDPRSEPGAVAVLLGHTREDQAETVLLGLARGSGTRSLAGMPPRQGLFRRPLLDLPRDLVGRAAAELAAEDPRLKPWSDPHNDDRAFARVRVRREALPALEAALGPGVVEALARTARLARADADALDGWADRIWEAHVRPALEEPPTAPGSPPGRISAPAQNLHTGAEIPAWSGDSGQARAATPGLALPVAALLGEGGEPLPPAITSRIVRRLLIEAGCPPGALSAEHVERVSALLHGPPGPAEIALPGGVRARREAGAVVVRA